MTLSLYNKYRPQVFRDVVGQEHVEKTLANAVKRNKVSHAYLFCGPRGTGKTTTARILAKALLCTKAPTDAPDGTCEFCHDISSGIHPDVYELDAASRTGVDNVREEIIGRVNFAPTQGKHKIYIIDEVHMLSTPAFNALLKTLEEPPPHVIFVLCTTDVHKVPETVQARCQRFDFKRLSSNEIVGRLQYICEREGFDHDSAALELIAARSQGGMRDAIRSLEQAAVFSSGNITFSAVESLLGMVDTEQLFILCDNLATKDAASCFSWVAGYVQSGSDIAILVNDLATHVRNLFAVHISSEARAHTSASQDDHLINALELGEDTLPRLRTQAAAFDSPHSLAWILTVLGRLSAELKSAANARLALEVALTRMLYPESETSLDALAARVARLEQLCARQSSKDQSYERPNSSVPAPGATDELSTGASTQETFTAEPTADVSLIAPDPEPALPPAPNAQDECIEGLQAAPDSNQQLHRQWNKVVDEIKKQRRGVAANLGGILPALSADGSCLTLELPAGGATSKQYLETDLNQQLLRETVDAVFGKPMSIKLTLGMSARGLGQDGFDAGALDEEPAPEPSVEEIESFLSSSFNSTIQFEE